MKISQAVKLGHQSIAGYKRRNLAAVVTAGILFGVLAGILMTVQGLENVILRAHDAAIEITPYYLVANTSMRNCQTETIPADDGVTNTTITCPEANTALLQAEVAKYHGEVLSDLSSAEIGEINQIAYKTPINLANLPSNVTPVLLAPGNALSFAGISVPQELNLAEQFTMLQETARPLIGQTFTKDNGEQLYFAGLLPTGNLAQIGLEYERGHWNSRGNLLDTALTTLGASTPRLPYGMVTLSFPEVTTPDYIPDYVTFVNYETYYLKFTNFADAYNFAVAKGCVDDYGSCEKERNYEIRPLAGNRVQLVYRFQIMEFFLKIVKYLIMAIALVIMLITCIKIIQAETKTIQLYRSLGASTADIIIIYSAYLLEFCLLVISFALLIGLMISGVLSVLNATALREMLVIAYVKEITWPVILIGWNFSLTQIVAAMILVAPVCLIICSKKFRGYSNR